MNRSGSAFGVVAEDLPLDELELGSLRGRLTAAALDMDLEARQGRGSMALSAPRFSGLRGSSLVAHAR